MADVLTVTDPKATNHAGINISTSGNYTAISSGTGLEYTWDGCSALLLKNGSAASRNFTFVVPVPAGSSLDDIGSTPSSKVYAVAAGETQYVRNADSFRDPTTGKGEFDVNGSDCSALAIAY